VHEKLLQFAVQLPHRTGAAGLPRRIPRTSARRPTSACLRGPHTAKHARAAYRVYFYDGPRVPCAVYIGSLELDHVCAALPLAGAAASHYATCLCACGVRDKRDTKLCTCALAHTAHAGIAPPVPRLAEQRLHKQWPAIAR
jgi:hypothetical protein